MSPRRRCSAGFMSYPSCGAFLANIRRSMFGCCCSVSLVDEGLDIGVRIGQLPDSSLRAVHVGEVRRIVCAAPQYIARHGMPAAPHDLSSHTVVACTAVTPIPDRWSFHGPSGVTS